MTPKELLLATLKCKPTPRPAWIPFAGAYASRLKGYTATEMFQSADKLTECLLEVNRMFKPDGECCIFDLQIEAEVLGCDLMWADDGPPSVASHPLATEMGDTPVVPCECTLPGPNDGRIPLVCEAMRRVKKEIGDTTALYGLITGPFTLASHLRGTDIFLDMLLDDQFVHDLLDYCYKAACKMAEYFIDAGMDVIAVVDPLISQISTEHFEEFCSEPFTKLFDHIREKGAYSSFFVCGDATRNIEVMCKTGCDSISVDENVNFKPAKEICDKYSVAFGGNIPLTTIMLHGTQMDNMKYCVDLIDSIENKNGLIVAPAAICRTAYRLKTRSAACRRCCRRTRSAKWSRTMLRKTIATSKLSCPTMSISPSPWWKPLRLTPPPVPPAPTWSRPRMRRSGLLATPSTITFISIPSRKTLPA